MGCRQLVRNLAVFSLLSSGSVAIAQPSVAADPLASRPVDSQDLEPIVAESSAESSAKSSAKSTAESTEIDFLKSHRAESAILQIAESPVIKPAVESHTLNRQTRLHLSQNAPASDLAEPAGVPAPLPESPSVLPDPNLPLEPEPSLPSVMGDQVMVTEIQVRGSSVFGDREFDPIVSPYEGRSLGLRELRQVADDITQLYLESGYITSRAVLSEQTVTNGVVQVQVIEGELEEIQVEGTSRLASYVRDRINLANRKPLNQVALESQLQLLRSDPLIDNIEASLRAGTGEGQSQLIVRVVEAPFFSGRVGVDTYSPPSVGIARTGIETNFNNLLGWGDRLALSAYRSTAGGSNSYDVTYDVPLNALNGTLQTRYLPSSFSLISESLSTLDIEGSSETYEFTYRQPVIRKVNEELAFSLGFRHRTGETLVSDVVIDSTRTSVFQVGQDYLKRDRSGAWGLRSQFNFGTGLLDATRRTDDEADGQFFSWLSQVQRAQVINRDNLLLIQGSLQLSPDSLLGADQFIIGGANSVRGYDQNARFGDNGLRFSIEDRITVLRDEDGSSVLQIAPFLDAAGVWNQGENLNDQRVLAGTGVGFVANMVENLQARLDVGIPLIELNESGDSNQDIFLYFNMDWRF